MAVAGGTSLRRSEDPHPRAEAGLRLEQRRSRRIALSAHQRVICNREDGALSPTIALSKVQHSHKIEAYARHFEARGPCDL